MPVTTVSLDLLEPAVYGEGLYDGILFHAREVENRLGLFDDVEYLGAGHIQRRHYLIEGVVAGELEVKTLYLRAGIFGERALSLGRFGEFLGCRGTCQEKYRKEKRYPCQGYYQRGSYRESLFIPVLGSSHSFPLR